MNIRDIQAQQGWTDATLVAVLLDWIDARQDRRTACFHHVEQVADEENNPEMIEFK